MTNKLHFEWDDSKNQENQNKHSIPIEKAQYTFADKKRIILEDMAHSEEEKRYYCIGKIGDGIVTVRFTYRKNIIHIFGTGYWRKGKRIYEKEKIC